MKDKVKKRIDDYLGFNSDELFESGDAFIFGGAVRDSIAEQKINDIDIISGPLTARRLHSLLESKGFKYMENLLPKDVSRLYTGIRIIAEPKTYINKNNKIVQVIRPSNFRLRVNTHSEYKSLLKECISNVDISCCGISYDGNEVEEHFPNAILHSACKIFYCNHGAEMSIPDRMIHRRAKLENRGWKEFLDSGGETRLIREYKIGKLVKD